MNTIGFVVPLCVGNKANSHTPHPPFRGDPSEAGREVVPTGEGGFPPTLFLPPQNLGLRGDLLFQPKAGHAAQPQPDWSAARSPRQCPNR